MKTKTGQKRAGFCVSKTLSFAGAERDQLLELEKKRFQVPLWRLWSFKRDVKYIRFATLPGLKGSSYLVSCEDILLFLLWLHSVTRVHGWFKIKGNQTGFLQEFQKSQYYRRPIPGWNLSPVNQSVLHMRDKRRGVSRKRMKRPRSRSTKWVGEKSTFLFTVDVTLGTSIIFVFTLYICGYLSFG